MQIKYLSIEDIDKILELEKESAPEKPFYAKYDESALKFLFNDSKSKAFGAFDKNKLIGWASYRSGWNKTNSKKGVYEMSSLVVDKNYRRNGIGLKLFNARLKDLLIKEDLKSIYASAYPKNIPIILLYLNNGFEIYDFKKNVYGKGADRIYLKYSKSTNYPIIYNSSCALVTAV